jgi:site-specific recombinase XerD
MQSIELHSWLSEPIDRFIELRRLSGTDYSSQARLLGYFDRFLVAHYPNGPTVTRQIVDHYLRSLSRLQPRGRHNRFCVVRQLCEYIARTEPRCHVPESLRGITSRESFCPYIFSGKQIEDLLSAASALPPSNSLRPHTYRTLFGLLYTTGIRIGEAFALTLNDFQPENDLLYIAEGKFRKARWVPLHSSTSLMLRQYVERRRRNGPRATDSPLFVNLRAGRLRHCTVLHTFRQLLEQCNIAYRKHAGPRIHDLRHTFAVHRLLAWYRDGQDVNARLPALATYMGHVDVTSTQVYLRPTAELLEHVSNRFHNHYLHHLKCNGGRS